MRMPLCECDGPEFSSAVSSTKVKIFFSCFCACSLSSGGDGACERFGDKSVHRTAATCSSSGPTRRPRNGQKFSAVIGDGFLVTTRQPLESREVSRDAAYPNNDSGLEEDGLG